MVLYECKTMNMFHNYVDFSNFPNSFVSKIYRCKSKTGQMLLYEYILTYASRRKNIQD